MLISITGIDGSGKSTLTQKLEELDNIKVLRVPQYHETPNSPFQRESFLLEEIGKLGDKIQNPILKANASYLAFCLYGDVVHELLKPNKIVLTERFPVLDALSFAKFYLQFLEAGCDETSLENLVRENYSNEDLEIVQKYILSKNFPEGTTLFNLHRYIVPSLKKPFEDLVNFLANEFNTPFPEKLVQLRINKGELEKRFESRQKEVNEAHEQIDILLMMQSALTEFATAVEKMNSDFKFESIVVDELDSDELLNKVKSSLNI